MNAQIAIAVFCFQCTRLDNAIQQLQVNFAATYQKNKSDMIRMEETKQTLEADLSDAKKHIETLTEDISDKMNQLTRADKEIDVHKDDLAMKVEEVSGASLFVSSSPFSPSMDTHTALVNNVMILFVMELSAYVKFYLFCL